MSNIKQENYENYVLLILSKIWVFLFFFSLHDSCSFFTHFLFPENSNIFLFFIFFSFRSLFLHYSVPISSLLFIRSNLLPSFQSFTFHFLSHLFLSLLLFLLKLFIFPYLVNSPQFYSTLTIKHRFSMHFISSSPIAITLFFCSGCILHFTPITFSLLA